MIKILSIIGTRPEGIKMAPVILELEKYPEIFTSIVCNTGQHREMLDQVLDLFKLRPDYSLDLMTANQTLPKLTADLLNALDEVVEECQPDWILAQGDTTTVMVASLLAFYKDIRFGHVEAGLRTSDLRSPFPEEVNRRIADLLTTAYFAPTEMSKAALLKEGCPESNIYVTGNTVIDALLQVSEMPCDLSQLLSGIDDEKRLILLTAHRRESFGGQFEEMCEAIKELAEKFSEDTHFVYPVHLNPNVQKPVYDILGRLENVSLIPPVDYLNMVHLMKRSCLIITDSGGIQEEGPSFGAPVLVMRKVTERQEGIEAGVVRLVGTSRNGIVTEASKLLSSKAEHEKMANPKNPYGDGTAAQQIVEILKSQ